MRSFVVICLLATSVYADVSHITGYSYEQNTPSIKVTGEQNVNLQPPSDSGYIIGQGTKSSSQSTPDISANARIGEIPITSATGIVSTSSSINPNGVGGSIIAGLGLGGTIVTGNAIQAQQTQQHRVELEAPQVEFVKEFYTFEAPQDNYHEDASVQHVRESLKKNLQVVFIKAPEVHGVEHAALSLAKTASESNTAIYVLQKQPDVAEFANQLNLIHTHNARKPEVHFIKYKTPEEALKAQTTIQAQYETLGGSSVHKNGGVPDILNFIAEYAPTYGDRKVVVSGGKPPQEIDGSASQRTDVNAVLIGTSSPQENDGSASQRTGVNAVLIGTSSPQENDGSASQRTDVNAQVIGTASTSLSQKNVAPNTLYLPSNRRK